VTDLERLNAKNIIGYQAVGILKALTRGKAAVLSKTAHPFIRKQVLELLKEWDANSPNTLEAPKE
jgi:hypothetical protein